MCALFTTIHLMIKIYYGIQPTLHRSLGIFFLQYSTQNKSNRALIYHSSTFSLAIFVFARFSLSPTLLRLFPEPSPARWRGINSSIRGLPLCWGACNYAECVHTRSQLCLEQRVDHSVALEEEEED